MNDNQTRDLIAAIIITTLCIAVLFKITLPDMYKDIVLMVIGFFFGSRGVAMPPGTKETTTITPTSITSTQQEVKT